MKPPVQEWLGHDNVETTKNSLYRDSVGTVTVTLPAEYAAVICGALGRMPGTKYLNDGRAIVFNGLYSALFAQLERLGLCGFDDPFAQYGREIVKSEKERPNYMLPPDRRKKPVQT